jgi:hypothetical protein
MKENNKKEKENKMYKIIDKNQKVVVSFFEFQDVENFIIKHEKYDCSIIKE